MQCGNFIAVMESRFFTELYVFRVPPDTKLLLTKNYSEIIIFEKITNFIRNSSKMPSFPGDFEGAKPLKN